MSAISVRQKAYAAFVAVCFFWGTTYIGIKIALETVPPFLLGGIRFTLAGTVLALTLRLLGRPWPSWRRAPLFLAIGFRCSGSATAVSSGPSSSWLAAWWRCWWLRRRSGWWASSRSPAASASPGGWSAGLLLGFSGILLLVWPDLELRSRPLVAGTGSAA